LWFAHFANSSLTVNKRQNFPFSWWSKKVIFVLYRHIVID
jgi:hypothetical protein